jgi:hypothetical protein
MFMTGPQNLVTDLHFNLCACGHIGARGQRPEPGCASKPAASGNRVDVVTTRRRQTVPRGRRIAQRDRGMNAHHAVADAEVREASSLTIRSR